MRRLALACLMLALVGCGKDSVVVVKRPVVPIYICRNLVTVGRAHMPTGILGLSEPCEGRFDAGQLIGMKLEAAGHLARAHGFALRQVAPLGKDEELTADFNLIG